MFEFCLLEFNGWFKIEVVIEFVKKLEEKEKEVIEEEVVEVSRGYC